MHQRRIFTAYVLTLGLCLVFLGNGHTEQPVATEAAAEPTEEVVAEPTEEPAPEPTEEVAAEPTEEPEPSRPRPALGPGEVEDGGHGLYWQGPDGHWLEIITRPYGHDS